jgi:hypothetical protein
MLRILAITATLLGIASAVQADVYRWTNSDGVVQYSDRWRPGAVLVKTDKSRPSPPPPASDSAESAPAPTGAERANELVAAQQDQQTVKQDVAKTKAEQCKKATEAYQQAIQSRRLFKEGANGAREYLSDPDADAYRLQMFNARKQLCGT